MIQVVITGADGFIGSHLVTFFNSVNIPVIALVIPGNKSNSRILSLENVTIIECNLNKWDDICLPIESDKDILFYHLAWAGVSPEYRNSIEKQLVNIQLALDAEKLAKKLNVKKFITLGSTMEYLYAGKPIDETALPTPQTAYGATKVAVRYLCQEFAREENLPFIYVVATGVYGADRLDDNVITYTARKLLHKERPSLTRLEQLWDYIHIDDLVKALYLIGEKGQSGGFYAVGHGDNYPLMHYVKIIHNLIDPTLPIGIGDIPYMTTQLPSSCVNLLPLIHDTGFKPKICFEEGVKDVIAFLEKEKLQP